MGQCNLTVEIGCSHYKLTWEVNRSVCSYYIGVGRCSDVGGRLFLNMISFSLLVDTNEEQCLKYYNTGGGGGGG